MNKKLLSILTEEAFSCPGQPNRARIKPAFNRFTFDPFHEHDDFIYLEQLRMSGRKRRYMYRRALERKFKDAPPNKWYGLESTALCNVPNSKCYGVLVDAGCGASPDCNIAIQRGFELAIGMDLWPDAGFGVKDPAFEGMRKSSVAWMNHDITGVFPLKAGSVNVILSQAVLDLMNFADRARFYQASYRALKMGGLLSVYICKLKRGHGFDIAAEKRYVKTLGFKIRTSYANSFLAEVPGG